MYTPWGTAQTIETIAEGITSVTTPSHGGIHLSPERFAQICPEWQETFAGGPWFEEDHDWAKVAVTFPEHFTPEIVQIAHKTIDWLTSPHRLSTFV